MKRIMIISAIVLIAFAGMAKAQELTPMQLKEARFAIYEWMDKYITYSQFSYEGSSKRRFVSLFESGETKIVNSYLPRTNDNPISATSYSDLVMDTLYKIKTSVKDVQLQREYLENGNYQCDLKFIIECGFVKSDDNKYCYPRKTFEALVVLRYNLESKEMKCVSFTTNDTLRVDYILHIDSANNRYIQYSDTVALQEPITALVNTKISHSDFDYKILKQKLDTVKNNIHIGGSVGPNFLTGDFGSFKSTTELYYDFYIGYYRQFLLKNGNRFGMEINVGLSNQSYNFSGSLSEKYASVDPDGGQYERWVDVSNFTEKINRMAIELPIAFRYDRMIGKKTSFFVKIGASVAYDITQKSNITADAKYSGYYNWLFDVVIDQNGIYDFGTFANSTASLKETAFNRLGVNLFGGFGFQHFLSKHFSLEYSLQYKNRVYNAQNALGERHLTDHEGDWNSSSYYFKSFNSQNLNFNVQLNINF